MEKLADEWVIQARLPFLDQSQFKTTIISPFRVDWNGGPDVQVVLFFPIAESQFGLDQSVIGELTKFSGATVLSNQGVVHCRPNVKPGLHVYNMGETKVDTLRLEKRFGKKVVGRECRSPKMG
jgi:hypothetical protein